MKMKAKHGMKPNKMEVVQARPVSYKFLRQETQKGDSYGLFISQS